MANSEDPFDVWFREQVHHIHNLDIQAGVEEGGPALLVYDSRAPVTVDLNSLLSVQERE